MWTSDVRHPDQAGRDLSGSVRGPEVKKQLLADIDLIVDQGITDLVLGVTTRALSWMKPASPHRKGRRHGRPVRCSSASAASSRPSAMQCAPWPHAGPRVQACSACAWHSSKRLTWRPSERPVTPWQASAAADPRWWACRGWPAFDAIQALGADNQRQAALLQWMYDDVAAGGGQA